MYDTGEILYRFYEEIKYWLNDNLAKFQDIWEDFLEIKNNSNVREN